MKCRICGASCRCKKAGPGICCSCHPHRRAAGRLFPTAPDMTEALRRFALLHSDQIEIVVPAEAEARFNPDTGRAELRR